MLPNVGWSELVIILGIVLLLFGAKKLPELAKSMGKSVNVFKKSLKEGEPEQTEAPEKPEDKKPG